MSRFLVKKRRELLTDPHQLTNSINLPTTNNLRFQKFERCKTLITEFTYCSPASSSTAILALALTKLTLSSRALLMSCSLFLDEMLAAISPAKTLLFIRSISRSAGHLIRNLLKPQAIMNLGVRVHNLTWSCCCFRNRC